MHYHRLAAFLSGCLILGSLFMIFVATQNFQIVDRVLAAPPPQAAQMFQKLGPESSRLLLRYMAGEDNRVFFVSWEIAEIILGLGLTAVLLLPLASGLLAGLSGGTVIIALFQHFWVTPQMISFGRLIDFGAGVGSPAYNQFWRLHGLYGVLEVVKLILLIVIAGFLLFSRRQGAVTAEPARSERPATEALHQ
jgi:hypothetical protein